MKERSATRVAAMVLLAALILLGGASRIDSLAQIPITIAAALAIGVATAKLPSGALATVRTPFTFLVVFAFVMALQLVPLPPALWGKLPGHELYLEAANIAELPQPWRPISISPALTWAALTGFLAPFATLLIYASLGREQSRTMVPVLLAAGAFSMVLGLAQVGGGPESSLRYYAITNPEAPVGTFANRNHFAFFLALMIPCMAIWARDGIAKEALHSRKKAMNFRTLLALLFIALLIPVVLLSGSRAGLLLALALLVPGAMLYTRGRRVRLTRQEAIVTGAGTAAIIAATVATILASRATAFYRLVDADPLGDLRAQYVAPSLAAARAFFPFGAGFGTFDPVFRRFEPFEILDRRYANHAHNELLELPIEGGLIAMFLIAVVVVWFVASSWSVWFGRRSNSSDDLARLGSLILGTLLIASVGDYPLRTPFLGSLFTLGAVWLAAPSSYSRASGEGDDTVPA